MTTPTTTPVDPKPVDQARLRRCRLRNRLDNPCPNPALSDDPKDIAICGHHAAQVMELINTNLTAAARKAQS